MAKPPREIWERYDVAFIGKGGNDLAFAPARQGAIDAAKILEHEHHLEITLHDLTPVAGAYADQAESIKEAFILGVDAILISVREPNSIQTGLELVNRHDIQIVTFDGDAPNSPRLATIQTDQRALGRSAMGELAQALPRGGEIAILAGPEDDPILADRLLGAQDALEGMERIKLLKVVHCAADFQAAVDALSRTEGDDRDQEIDAWLLLGRWPLMGAATIPWDPKRTPSVCVDALPPMLPYLAQHEVDALIAQLYYRWGYLAMETAINAIHLKQKPPEEIILTGNEKITARNLADYGASWTEWLR